MSFRDRFQNFMVGRYGMDEFGKFLNIVSLVLLVISIFIQFLSSVASYVLWGVTLVIIGYSYYRMFSRNISARQKENQWYCKLRYRNPNYSGRGRFGSYGYNGNYNNGPYGNTYSSQTMTNEQKKAMDRKTHKIFKCPNCAQKIRVPKHRGKICIKCPKCRIEFIKKT